MSLFTLFPTLRSQPISRVLRDSRPLWATLDAFDDILSNLDQPVHSDWFDANETDTAYTFTLALPGWKKSEVEVSVEEETYLKVHASHVGPTDAKGNALARCFHRSITLPSDADLTKVEAKLEDGLLLVTIAKQAKPTPPAPRKVTVS